MKSLTERHAERAARKAENQLEASPVKGQDHLTAVVAQVAAAEEAIAGLSDADRQELSHRLSNDGEPSDGFVATDPGARQYAGIGLVNPFEAPASQGGNGSGVAGDGGISNLSPEEIRAAADEAQRRAAAEGWGGSPDTGNLNGAAIEAAGGGNQGGEGGNANEAKDETVDADGKALTKDALKAILDGRNPPVKYETDANLERLQTLVKENPATATA